MAKQSAKKKAPIPWSRSNLKELDVTKALKFRASPKKHGTIRKQASVAGSEAEPSRRYKVNRQGHQYMITRVL